MSTTHEIDRTPVSEVSVDESGSLVIRGQRALDPSESLIATREDIARIVAAMNGAPVITEASIVAWLRAKRDASGIPNIAFACDSDYGCGPFLARNLGDGCEVEFGATPDECFAGMRKRIKTPAQLAAVKREQAKKLLAEADALTPKNHHPMSSVDCRP